MEPIALPLALTAETLAPNAFELKQRYNTFLARGLAVAALVHLVGLGAFRLVENMQPVDAWVPPTVELINVLPPSPPITETPPEATPPPSQAAVPVGTPTPVPDAQADAQTTPTQTDLAVATPGPAETGIRSLAPAQDLAVRPFVPPTPPPVPPAPIPTPAPPAVFDVAEVQPVLIGGLDGLQANIEYPDLARRAGVQGRVVVQFVVDEQGVPTDIRVVRSDGAQLNDAAMRAVQQARFEPGMQRGRAVKVRFTLPITFRLQ